MGNFLAYIITFLMFLLPGPALGQMPGQALGQIPEIQIEKKCRDDFPNFLDFFSRKKCVKMGIDALVEQRRAEAERHAATAAATERENKARPCLAVDVPRMEALAKSVSESINPQMNREEILRTLDRLLERNTNVKVGYPSIRSTTLENAIVTQCDSIFAINILIFLTETEKPSSISFLANVSPGTTAPPTNLFGRPIFLGYDNKVALFDRDFLAEQREAQLRERAQAERQRQAQGKRTQEMAVRALENRRTEALKGIVVSNILLSCPPVSNCTLYSVTATVENRSKEVITHVEAGFNIQPTGSGRCPDTLPDKEKKTAHFGPGEKVTLQFLGRHGLFLNQGLVTCFKILSVDLKN